MTSDAASPVIRSARDLGLQLRAAGDIRDLLGAAYGLDALLLHEADLAPAFLDLRTGLLGELFQTLVNHRLPTALIVPVPAAHGGRFTELAREHARHPHVRILPDEAAARAWLAAAR